MDGQESDDQKQSTADMTAFVQNLLLQMQGRFQAMSESIVSKRRVCWIEWAVQIGNAAAHPLDEMGTRIDELEQSINDLKTEMGADSSSPLAPAKTKPEETKPTDGST